MSTNSRHVDENGRICYAPGYINISHSRSSNIVAAVCLLNVFTRKFFVSLKRATCLEVTASRRLGSDRTDLLLSVASQIGTAD